MRIYLGIIFICVTVFGQICLSSEIIPINERKELSLDQLSNIILSPANHVSKVEDVVPLLPDILRSNYVMVTDSKSLQEGTKDNPRIVMFGRAANIFVAFNGGKGRGNNTIEAIEHHRETNTYEFRRYEFATDGSKHVTEIRNPTTCIGCHGKDAHPIWDPYQVWPSATPRSFLVNAQERTYIEGFINTAFNNPRYKDLLRQKNLDDMINIKLETSMASQLDDQLDEERYRRFVAHLKATPQYESFKYAFLGALSYCPNVDSYLPPAVATRMNAVSTRAAMVARTAKEIHDSSPEHDFLFSFTPANAEVTGTVRWLLETRSISMDDFGISKRSRYLFTTTADGFYPEVIAQLSGDRSTYLMLAAELTTPVGRKALLTLKLEAEHATYCEGLKAKSLQQSY